MTPSLGGLPTASDVTRPGRTRVNARGAGGRAFAGASPGAAGAGPATALGVAPTFGCALAPALAGMAALAAALAGFGPGGELTERPAHAAASTATHPANFTSCMVLARNARCRGATARHLDSLRW